MANQVWVSSLLRDNISLCDFHFTVVVMYLFSVTPNALKSVLFEEQNAKNLLLIRKEFLKNVLSMPRSNMGKATNKPQPSEISHYVSELF